MATKSRVGKEHENERERERALRWVAHQLRWERTLDELRTARAGLETRLYRAA